MQTKINHDKVHSKLFQEDNVWLVIYLGFCFCLLQTSYSSFQEFLPLIMQQEEIKYISNLCLGFLYSAHCFSELFISPFIFSLYKGHQRRYLFFFTSLTFLNLVMAFQSLIQCFEYQDESSKYFYCNPIFYFPYCLISSILCGIGGSIIWLTQGIYMCKCCRPWNRGRFSGLFFLVFNFSLVSGNFMGYYILKEGYLIFYYFACASICILASFFFLFTVQPKPLKKTIVNQTLVFKSMVSNNKSFFTKYNLSKFSNKKIQKRPQILKNASFQDNIIRGMKSGSKQSIIFQNKNKSFAYQKSILQGNSSYMIMSNSSRVKLEYNNQSDKKMDTQDDRIVEEEIEINEKDRRISEFQNRLIRQNYQKYIQGKMGNQEWNLDINNQQKVPEEPENLNQSQQENFKLGSSFYTEKNYNGQISENQDEINNLEIKKQKNDNKQQEDQTFQVQNLDSLANSVDMIKQTNGSDYQTSSEKSQGKIQKESNFSLLDLQKEQSQILVKEDMDLVGMRNQIKNEQLQFNPNDSQYQSEIRLFPTIQNPFSSRLYYLDHSLNDMLNSESANKEDQDEIFMNNMIFGKTFTEERGFYNFVYKNKKKSKRNRMMQQMAQDGYNKSISHIIPHLKQSRLGTSSQMTNTNYKNYSMYDQIVMDKSVSSFGHKGGSQLQANKTIVQGGSSDEVLTYKDFLTFLRHDKTIRNLIPLYILSGLFYGFWQKLGPIVVQFTKQEKMNIMYKNIYDDTGVIFIISGIVQFFLGPIFGYTFDLANAKWKKRIMALLLIICFIALALFPLPFIDTQAFYHTDEKRTGQIIFTLIGVLFGIFNCGVNTTGGPIRSGAFKSERRLVLSFATYRLVYFASIAVSFFCTLGVPYSVIPFIIPVILLIFAIISVKTILFNHKY